MSSSPSPTSSTCWPRKTRGSSTIFVHCQRRNLLEIATDPKRLGAEIGIISILHTWGQNLLLHPHIHCAIPAGGLSLITRVGPSPLCFFSLP